MVRRLTQLLETKVRGLHEAAYLLGIFALLSQLLALVRDRLFAGSFGAGEVLDTYYASFKIPDFLFVSIASLVSVYVLIPFLTERLEESKEKTKRMLDSVFTAFSLMLIASSLIVFLIAPWLLTILFPGFANESLDNLVMLTRIMLLQPMFLGISNLIASITQIRGRFVLYAASPLLYNLGIIFGVLVLYPIMGIAGLAWGVVFGALMHLLLQVPFVAREGLLPRITTKPSWDIVMQVMKVSLPRTLTLSANQITLLLLVSIGSILATGSISVFQLALNLQSVPLAIIGVSYSVAAFPTLARMFAEGKKSEFVAQIGSAMRHVIFWSLPALALVIVLRAQLVRVILGSGEFNWEATRLTAAGLALFVTSLTAQALVLLLVRGYYAAGNTRKPLIINVLSSVFAIVSAYALVFIFQSSSSFQTFIEQLLRVQGIEGTNVLMLPLGYTLGMLINAVVLLQLFQRDYGDLRAIVRPVLWKTGFASIFASAAAYQVLSIMDEIVDINTFWGIFGQGLAAGVTGMLACLLALYVLKSQELAEAWAAVHHKFWKTKTVIPEAVEVEQEG